MTKPVAALLAGVAALFLVVVCVLIASGKDGVVSATPVRPDPAGPPPTRADSRELESRAAPAGRQAVGGDSPSTSASDGAKASTSSSPAESLEQTIADLGAQVDASLDGTLFIDELLDQVLRVADLPVDPHVDFDYQDNDGVAYRVEGTPEGTRAHFLVGLEPFERDGKEFRYFHMEIQLGADAPSEFHRDALREGPRVHLSIDYDEQGKPGRLGLLTERRVALGDSRPSGIDAYQGSFTSGASFHVDLADPRNARAETFGIVDGHYVQRDEFEGMPLRGDLEVDRARVEALLARLTRHYESVRRKAK